MDVSDWLSLAAIIISVCCLLFQIIYENKFRSKQKIMDEIYDIIYVKFPKKMDDFLKQRICNEDSINDIKDFICDEMKPVFSFIRFRNVKRYNLIKNHLSKIEDLVCKLLDCNDCFECKKQLELAIKKFYKSIDKYLLITK